MVSHFPSIIFSLFKKLSFFVLLISRKEMIHQKEKKRGVNQKAKKKGYTFLLHVLKAMRDGEAQRKHLRTAVLSLNTCTAYTTHTHTDVHAHTHTSLSLKKKNKIPR